MTKPEDVLSNVRSDVAKLIQDSLADYKDAATTDWDGFYGSIKDDLARWSVLLAEKRLTKEDVESLVRGKKDLCELEALKQVGLGQVRMDKFRESLISILIKAAIGLITRK